MARKPRSLPVPGAREQVLTALHQYTQKELAARLGVSDRTIRRWKRGETEPRSEFVALALRDEYRHERDAINRYTRKEAPGAHPPRSAIPLLGHRRELNEYGPDGRKTGGKILSDYVNYNVSRLDADSILAILQDLRDKGASIQLIHRVKQYKGEAQFLAPGERNATGIIRLTGLSDTDLFRGRRGTAWKGLRHYISQGNNTRLLYIGVIDR